MLCRHLGEGKAARATSQVFIGLEGVKEEGNEKRFQGYLRQQRCPLSLHVISDKFNVAVCHFTVNAFLGSSGSDMLPTRHTFPASYILIVLVYLFMLSGIF